jgi:hypothetical protein
MAGDHTPDEIYFGTAAHIVDQESIPPIGIGDITVRSGIVIRSEGRGRNQRRAYRVQGRAVGLTRVVAGRKMGHG